MNDRPGLPTKALWVALVGLLLANVGGVLGYSVGLAISPSEKAPALVLSELLLWAGMIGACWYAAAAFGTGNFRVDFGVCPKLSDVGWGLLFAAVDWAAATAVSQAVSLLGKSYAGSNSDIVTDVRGDVPALVATIVFAIVGAPIVEELFFRGLVQRALQPWAGVVGAIVVQGLFFGGVHVVETTGAGRLGLWLALSAVGIIHGIVYQRFKRITPAMWTHAFFNVSGVVLIFAAVTPH